MIYYPLSTLMLAGIRDILIITTPADQPLFVRLLKDGAQWGIDLSYAVQPAPEGLAQAFTIGRHFIGDGSVALVLGDNLHYGEGFAQLLAAAVRRQRGASIFAYWVSDPERYGVVDFNDDGVAVSIEEKPAARRNNWAITGLYFYDSRVVDFAASLKPSARGELEITDLNNIATCGSAIFTSRSLGRGFAWLDTGTHQSMLEASQFVRTIEERQAQDRMPRGDRFPHGLYRRGPSPGVCGGLPELTVRRLSRSLGGRSERTIASRKSGARRAFLTLSE